MHDRDDGSSLLKRRLWRVLLHRRPLACQPGVIHFGAIQPTTVVASIKQRRAAALLPPGFTGRPVLHTKAGLRGVGAACLNGIPELRLVRALGLQAVVTERRREPERPKVHQLHSARVSLIYGIG